MGSNYTSERAVLNNVTKLTVKKNTVESAFSKIPGKIAGTSTKNNFSLPGRNKPYQT